jgi:DNA-directed RNA polymerase specialized sigma24 family protein
MDDAEPDAEHDTRELDRLVRFMSRKGQRFGLALATYRDAGVAAEQRELAVSRMGAHALRVSTIELRGASDDVVAALEAASAAQDVIFMTGLDEIIHDLAGTSPLTHAIQSLNLRRDDLPERVDARVVFWVSADAYPQLAKLAWDLLDVMLTRFEFRGERAVEAPPVEVEPYRPQWLRVDDAVDVGAHERQVESLVRTATTATDPHTIADAAASAGAIFAALGRLDDASQWIERAADVYEQLASQAARADVIEAAVAQRRRLAEVNFVRGGDEGRARMEASRALDLIDRQQESSGTVSSAISEDRAACSYLLAMTGPPDASPTERGFELLRRWHDGDLPAAEALLMSCFRRLDDYFRDKAENRYDLIMATFAGLLDDPQPADQRNFERHVVGVARQVFVDHLRGQSERQPHTVLPDELRSALDSLPVRTQDLLELHYVHGLTIAELSAVFGVVEPTIYARINRAAAALLREYRARGHIGMDEQALLALLRPGGDQP